MALELLKERNDYFGYRRYEALTKHVKLFKKKNIKVKGCQCQDYEI